MYREKSMRRNFIIFGLLAIGARAYTPIQWTELPGQKAIHAPKAVQSRTLVLPPSWRCCLLESLYGQPTLKWKWVPSGYGGMSQLEETNKCLDVAKSEGDANGAPIAFQNCERELPESWSFGETMPLLKHSAVSRPARPFSATRLTASIFVLAMLSVGAFVWRVRHSSVALPMILEGMPCNLDEGGVALTTTSTFHQESLSCKVFAEKNLPAVMAQNPAPVNENTIEPRDVLSESHGRCTRRDVAALLSLLVPAREVQAFPELPNLPFFEQKPKNLQVEVLESPEICQGRCLDQDFIVIKYIGRFSDGRVFDDRYATEPLVYELGGFYLDGVDQTLVNQCVGTKFLLKWSESPELKVGTSEDMEKLPAGSAIEMEIELKTIKYSLFGEKMRGFSLRGSKMFDNPDDGFFAQSRLTLSSPVDERGHLVAREPTVKKENPFAVGPGEISFITSPTSQLAPLWETYFGSKNPTDANAMRQKMDST